MWLLKILDWFFGLSDSKIERLVKFVGESRIRELEYLDKWTGTKIRIVNTSDDGRAQVTTEKLLRVKYIEITSPKNGTFQRAVNKESMKSLEVNDLINKNEPIGVVIYFGNNTENFTEILLEVTGKVIRLASHNTKVLSGQVVAIIETTSD